MGVMDTSKAFNHLIAFYAVNVSNVVNTKSSAYFRTIALTALVLCDKGFGFVAFDSEESAKELVRRRVVQFNNRQVRMPPT